MEAALNLEILLPPGVTAVFMLRGELLQHLYQSAEEMTSPLMVEAQMVMRCVSIQRVVPCNPERTWGRPNTIKLIL